jgi:hypothetical protein
MATAPVATTADIQALMTKALAEGAPHSAAVEFDDLFEVLGGPVWGVLPKEDALPDVTISSHIREVANDPQAKNRLFAVIVNKALNVINPNHGLGHGTGAMAGDLARACRIVSVLLKWLGIPSITITAGEDPAKIVASVAITQAPQV